MILVKTEVGQQAFKDRSVRLTPRQRSAFILCDGKRTVGDVLGAGMGIGQADIDQMVQLGLLGQVADAGTQSANSASVVAPQALPSLQSPAPAGPPVPQEAPETPEVPEAPVRSAQQRYQAAYPIATRLTAGLGLRGFRLNLSVEAATNYEQLAALAPKIRAAVGEEKSAELARALAA